MPRPGRGFLDAPRGRFENAAMASPISTGPDEPFIPPARSLPEITIRALVLGVLLSAVLAAANAYLGLFAGLTVSASIPAAVISMGVLRALGGGNILENNIVQTAASAGESLAAGVIFTIPALVILGVWTEFDYVETTIMAGLGGVIGVLFTIPLRRALIVEDPLQFPEGVATAEVLKAGDQGGSGVKYIAVAGLVGGLFKFGEAGLRLWGAVFQAAGQAGSTLLYFGSNLSPALVAVGYIVGLNIAILVFLGGALNWLVAIPLYAAASGIPEGTTDLVAYAEGVWSSQTRYLGVGAMVVGGVWALLSLRRSLARGIRASLAAWRESRGATPTAVPRTEQDTPFTWVGVALLISLVPLYLVFDYFIGDEAIAAVMAGVMLLAGFLFSAVAGYMAGLVGSSNNPISGVTIATILTSALLLYALGTGEAKGPASAIFIGAVVCCAAAIAGDNMQDLKAGHVLGATPWKQQVMQIVGVLAAAAVIAPILALLHEAYGIGVESAAHPDPLPAPQASLMASVARGVFHQDLPWGWIAAGMGIAVGIIVLDVILERRGSDFRTPVLAVAVGIYLPFQLSVPILAGGLVAWAAARFYAARGGRGREAGGKAGLLFAAGLITGEALIGILMAVPIVATGDKNALALFEEAVETPVPGILLLVLVIAALYRIATAPARSASA